jgi:hypothetical protein
VTDRLITANARTTSGADFARPLGLRIRSAEQKQAEWDAQVQWYVERILAGCEFSEFGNPAVRQAKELIALRDAEAQPDPFEGRFAA